MSESNKKTPRTFQCRDALWGKFEELAKELECSVDYLINDAMKQYARQRGYAGSTISQTGIPVPPASTSGAIPPGPPPSIQPPAHPPVPAAPVAAAPVLAAPVPARPPAPVLPSSGNHPLPPPPPAPSVSRAPLPPPPAAFSGAPTLPGKPPVGPPPPRSSGPGMAPPPPPAPHAQMAPPPMPAAAPAQARPLILECEGDIVAVTKERFIIGRGKQVSDLTIRDPNVSRQHAVVEFIGGVFYMVDMGSTNGIEFSGQRVHRKAIQQGDVFRICDHEIHCTYQ